MLSRRRKLARWSSRSSHRRRAPQFEPLEPRLVLDAQIFEVTTTADTINPGDGVQSLREAIIAANAVPLSDEVYINFPFNGGTFRIERHTFVPGSGDSDLNPTLDPQYGDFDIRRSMTINGNGAVIRGEGIGRGFQVSGGGEVTFNLLTIQNGGFVSHGSGMHVSGGTDVNLLNVRLWNNVTTLSTNAGCHWLPWPA